MGTILPSGEEIFVTPEEILRYVSSDNLRQIMRQERLRWNLKPDKDVDKYSKTTNYKYSGDLHNEGDHQRMEVRTFPDSGANPGYAGVAVDGGEFGLTHNRDKWDHAMTDESKESVAQRVEIGTSSNRDDKTGYGLENGTVEKNSHNREASIVFDSYDGRAYLLSNDEAFYINNESRAEGSKLPLRTVARIADIPTKITDLTNDSSETFDSNYSHTDNDFNTSNRYVLDNIDDRTFVYPEISKSIAGTYINNTYMGLSGGSNYNEGDSTGSDGGSLVNTQPEIGSNNDRQNAAINSYNKNKNFSGNNYPAGFFPGIFRSFEELEKVDILRQKRTLMNASTPGGRRRHNYYAFDGTWEYDVSDVVNDEAYMNESHSPANLENPVTSRKPTPYNNINQVSSYNSSMLYQWRYNRVSVYWKSDDVTISIVNPGTNYKVGDLLRYNGELIYQVTSVTGDGGIINGHYVSPNTTVKFQQNPSTNGVGMVFSNYLSVGKNATLSISCKATVSVNATQIKNNLYAYVDVVPTVRSNNTSNWADNKNPSTDSGVIVRSTAPSPAYSGINSGRGGNAPSPSTSESTLYEHGGNATAGPHIHLFKYVINTVTPTWEMVDDVKVYTGAWVDCGPLGVERPADIKALLFSNPDCNNFNNFYKFSSDISLDTMLRNPDSVVSNNPTAMSNLYLHVAQTDPAPNQRFTIKTINPNTSQVEIVDITNRVLYINMGTKVQYLYNSGPKNDSNYGFDIVNIGWVPLIGLLEDIDS